MDWPSTWFGFTEKLGDSMKIISAKIDNSGTPQWFVMDHTQMDGVGALSQILYGAQGTPPQSKRLDDKEPSFFKILVAIYKHVRSRSKKLDWKNYNPKIVGVSPVMAWTLFTPEQTKALMEFSHSQKISLNTLMLFCLDSVVRKKFISGEESRWSIPVNMRGIVKNTEYKNQVSFLNVSFKASLSMKEFQQKISNKFKEKNHWANWALMHVGKHIGLEKAENLYKKSYANPNPECGTFSGFGEWTSKAIQENEAFITAAPTGKLTPLTFAAVIVNEKLSSVLQIHPSLSPSAEDVSSLLTDWTLELEKLSGFSLNNQKVSTMSVEKILTGL